MSIDRLFANLGLGWHLVPDTDGTWEGVEMGIQHCQP